MQGVRFFFFFLVALGAEISHVNVVEIGGLGQASDGFIGEGMQESFSLQVFKSFSEDSTQPV